MWDAFRQGLHELGYVEGRNIILEFRLVRGDYSLFSQLTAELVALPVDVIVRDGGINFVLRASGQVPIVHPTLFDPVGQGLASSLCGRAVTSPASPGCLRSSTPSGWSC